MNVLGALLILMGGCIGGAMLALPMATAIGGFYHTVILLTFSCVVMVVGALFVLEICIALPEDTNLVSMAKHTLGPIGQLVTWLSYITLIYALLAAYISSGADVLAGFFQLLHIHLPDIVNSILFILIFGFILFKGIAAVDWVNRLLMLGKLGAYIILIILFAPHVNTTLWQGGNFSLLLPAIMVTITSFGYGTLIPTIRSYLKSNVVQLRVIIIAAGIIPLLIYILWVGVVQGLLSIQQLHAISQDNYAITALTDHLSALVHSDFIKTIAHFFTSICVLTAFLGLGIGATDFFSDGFKIKKKGIGNYKVILITLLLPFFCVVFYPAIFIHALSFAGICCVVLFVLLPSLMVWFHRYVKRARTKRVIFGGRFLVIVWIIVSVILLAVAIKGYGQ